MSDTPEGFDAYMFKVLVVGSGGAGKTCSIKKLVYNVWTPEYKATIGVDFAFKVLRLDEKTYVRLQLWDIAGQERYSNLTRAYYKDAFAAFVVGDITTPTFREDVLQWKRDIDSKVTFPDTQSPIPCVLLANKVDLPKGREAYDQATMDALCEEHGFLRAFATSAKTGEGLQEATEFLVRRVLEDVRERQPVMRTSGVIIPSEDSESEDEGGCCGK
eukprot:gnl/Dysnectes_brevis/580_a642_5658.p1 GENE.gnl/Dysnectes_brevis/580_a642_5658~~gnl/Dysnectes_brevis/580_a642_5658.p1  ORF type:complete len:225 (-),score=43.35 gnl/Dysnectes_brevis/580_a642_5658:74-721(-)